MNIISDSFRSMLWFVLCVAMALGMIAFAIFYGAISFMLAKIAWRKSTFSIPSLKTAKLKFSIS